VLEIISASGLEYQVGAFSTSLTGDEGRVFALIREIYRAMEESCGFVLDVRLSNVCGCRAKPL